MATSWQAVVVDKPYVQPDRIELLVVLVSDTQKVDRRVVIRNPDLDAAGLNAILVNLASQVPDATGADKLVALAATFTPGLTIPIVFPDPPAPPTPEEIARSKWLTAYRQLLGMQRGNAAAGLGLDTSALEAQVKGDFLPDYAELL